MLGELEVALCGQTVGRLALVGSDRWSFVYNDEILQQRPAAPLSVALPRSKAAHQGGAVHAVFAGLLPDSSLRQRLARSLGVPERNTLDLLARVGRECHGGITLAPPPGTRAPLVPPGPAPLPRVLDAGELRNAMAALLIHPLLAAADGLSKTLPGEYDKLPVRMAGDHVEIVVDDALTTHVVKPARPGLRESVVNEGYCMALAAAFGLQVVETTVLSGRVSVLAVRRCDRIRRDAGVSALHMEDFGQALGYAPEHKYEREGGPRLAEIVELLRRVSIQPALDLRELLRWLVFSFLIGYGGGHARQLALMLGPEGPTLAPFFGIWSTHCYAEMSFRMGIRIDNEDRPDWLTTARWIECATALGVRPRYLLDELYRAATRLPRLAAELAEEFQRKFGYAEIIGTIRALIEQRARQALVSLEAERIRSPADVA
jgi:serine/threonine-protein kinase HipA